MALQSSKVYNNHFLHRVFGSDLRLFELSVWMQSAALSLITVFVPVILYKLGLGIRGVFGFYLLWACFELPISFAARKFIARYGARTAMIVAISAQVLYAVLLFNFRPEWGMVAVMALAVAIYDSFYWIAHLYIFVESEHTTRLGMDVGMVNIARTVGGLIAPAIGALIYIRLDAHVLIGIAGLMMFASLIPLSRMKGLKFIPEKKPDGFKHFFSQPLERANYFFETISAISDELEDIIWPFFIFFVYLNIRDVAYVAILVAAADIILSYVTAQFTMRVNIYRLIARGALAMCAVWLLRLFAPAGGYLYFGSVFVMSLLAIFVSLPLEVGIFQRGQKISNLNAMTFRSAARMVGRIVLYAVMLLFVHSFEAAFIVGAVMFFMLFATSLSISMFSTNLEKLVPEPIIDELA